jgi:hypothetical protein
LLSRGFVFLTETAAINTNDFVATAQILFSADILPVNAKLFIPLTVRKF